VRKTAKECLQKRVTGNSVFAAISAEVFCLLERLEGFAAPAALSPRSLAPTQENALSLPAFLTEIKRPLQRRLGTAEVWAGGVEELDLRLRQSENDREVPIALLESSQRLSVQPHLPSQRVEYGLRAVAHAGFEDIRHALQGCQIGNGVTVDQQQIGSLGTERNGLELYCLNGRSEPSDGVLAGPRRGPARFSASEPSALCSMGLARMARHSRINAFLAGLPGKVQLEVQLGKETV
jgi:hypothetical protein